MAHSGRLGASTAAPLQQKSMKHILAEQSESTVTSARARYGSGRWPLLVLVFGLGAGLTALWFLRPAPPHNTNSPEEAGAGQLGGLSQGTQSLLGRLNAPVEIRYYSLLDPATVPETTRGFADRVDQLLAQYRQAANGKIKVTRYKSLADSSANAAADGLTPFNLDKGDACYLGLVVLENGRKEILGQLTPEWEAAVEPDLSRAIERANRSANPGAAVATAMSPAVTEEVKRSLPKWDTVSVEEGTKTLRNASLAEFKAALDQSQAQLQDAEQQLIRAQNGGSEAEQQAAMRRLQQVQSEQTEKLKEISLRAETQVRAFQQLKAGGR
jgi:hypothetical protein